MSYLALDIGGSSIKYGLIDTDGNILSSGESATDTSSLNGFLLAIQKVKNTFHHSYAGVAVSMPGKIDMNHGIAETGGNYKFIHNLPLKDLLENIFGQRVVIANDGKCAAAAEAWKGNLAGIENGAIIVIGSGIGGGLILNNQLYFGTDSAAGEFSWLPVSYSKIWHDTLQDDMRDQRSVIWSDLCSTSALLKNYANAIKADPSSIDGYRFFRDYKEGNEDAICLFREFSKNMASGIFSIQAILDLNRYVIGGGISKEPLVTESIRNAVDELFVLTEKAPCKKPEILISKYHNDANLIGALYFYLHQR
ncbi:ROK family protein [Anaerolactibacter massiliensis]|uniref:ROK family protein n=1 Tax=Anaerolactibacter massiliensis TaxID=2044573 RepID=UPI000CF9A27F|nr:ROK family protein [Anaerolactibacter massiliensis]